MNLIGYLSKKFDSCDLTIKMVVGFLLVVSFDEEFIWNLRGLFTLHSKEIVLCLLFAYLFCFNHQYISWSHSLVAIFIRIWLLESNFQVNCFHLNIQFSIIFIHWKSNLDLFQLFKYIKLNYFMKIWALICLLVSKPINFYFVLKLDIIKYYLIYFSLNSMKENHIIVYLTHYFFIGYFYFQ